MAGYTKIGGIIMKMLISCMLAVMLSVGVVATTIVQVEANCQQFGYYAAEEPKADDSKKAAPSADDEGGCKC